MNYYRNAMQDALLNGYYIPELESLWFREDNFKTPKFFVYVMH
jgi:hypothetical protein